jgi:thiol-disulfide isomerase/thioredoxin
MKKLIILLFSALVVLSACKHEKVYNQIVKDPKTGEDILIGYVNIEGLKGDLFKDAYIKGLSEYMPNDSTVQECKKLMNGVSYRIIMGTWCSDSQEEVPRFFQVLYTADVDVLNPEIMEIICVNSNKEAGDAKIKKYNIEKVPTFIIYRNGKEIGRIIERFADRPETDLLEILKKQ